MTVSDDQNVARYRGVIFFVEQGVKREGMKSGKLHSVKGGGCLDFYETV